MNPRERSTRRQFLKTSGFLTGGLAIGTVVGCGDSNKKGVNNTESPASTTKIALSPKEQTPTSEAQITPSPEIEPQIEQSIFPASVIVDEASDPDWKFIDIKLGIVNNTNQMIRLGLLADLEANAELKIGEYTYSGSGYIGRNIGSNQYETPILPPGFAATFFAGDEYSFDNGPYVFEYSFKVPKTVTGNYNLLLEDVDFDLPTDVKDNIQYPSERPDSDFLEIGSTASFIIPQPQNDDNKGVKITLDSLSPVVDPNYLNTDGPYKLYSLKGTAENQSQGYEANPPGIAFVGAFMIGDDSGIYLDGEVNSQTPTGGWTLPFMGFSGFDPRENSIYGLHYKESILAQNMDPGRTIQFEIAIIIGKTVGKAKLVLPELDGAIINLNL